jgi:hypothetical protein
MRAALLLNALQARGAVVNLTPDGKVRVTAPGGVLDDFDAGTALSGEGGPRLSPARSSARQRTGASICVGCVSFVSSTDWEHQCAERLTLLTQMTHGCGPVLPSSGTTRSGGVPAPLAQPDWGRGGDTIPRMPPSRGDSEQRWAVG